MTEMIELEDQEDLIQNEQDIETAAYKEAFDHFDWNHSGRIPTSVKFSNSCFLIICFRQIEGFSWQAIFTFLANKEIPEHPWSE